MTEKTTSKKVESAQSITVRLVGSPIRRDARQREYIKALGLRKLGSEKVLQDSSSVRGLLRKAQHMVKVLDA